MTETVDSLPGSTLAGCKIMEKLGQGGMGSVYKARHQALDKVVCVKILSPELAREERNIEFFLREARSAAKLEHPNIVHVYNFGQENGSYFIVMSYVEGRSLADIVAEKGPMSVDAATSIILRVLEGLAHAHSHTIIHRDIKPSNILLGADGQPRIVDFGLARSINEEKQLTIAGEMVGTAYFMSPEQGLAGKVDHRADLYSTGATYFYLLTARYPFEGKSAIEVIHKHISDPFPNLIVLNPDIPLWVPQVLEKMTRKKPEGRHQTAAEVIDDINRRRAASRDGTDVSTERSIEIPGLSTRLGAQEAAPAAGQPPPAPLKSGLLPPELPKPRPPTAPPLSDRQPRLPLPPDAVRTAVHLSLTFAAFACFLLAGSAGRPETGALRSLLSPLISNPAVAGISAAAGLALMIWAAVLKPLGLTYMHAFCMAAAALAAYAGGIYAPAPETAGAASKALSCLGTALRNLASPLNIPVYALFFYLGASKFAFTGRRTVKAGVAAAYCLSLLLTYLHFANGGIVFNRTYLAAAGACALAGLAAAFTAKRPAVFFNPAPLFLAANALIFLAFAAPQTTLINERMAAQDAARVEQANKEAYAKYYAAVAAAREAVPEYDLEGKPVPKKLPAPPEKLQSAGPGAFVRAARIEYYNQLAAKAKNDMANAASMALISLFLLSMANVYFMEELFGNRGRDG